MRIVFVIVTTIFGSIAIWISICGAASFDCQKAKTGVERIVCASPELSKLDYEMAVAYSAVLTRATALNYSAGLTRNTTPEQLHSQQRIWLFSRNKCTDVACLTSAYVKQINILKSNIYIPFYDRTGEKSDDMKIIGIQCDKTTKTLEVGYFSAYNFPDNSMELWETSSLKTNSKPDDHGNQYVLAVHEIVRNCSFDKNNYAVTITAEPASWGMTGPCGGLTFGRATILKNSIPVFDMHFEDCRSEEIVTTVKISSENSEPTIIKVPRKDYEEEEYRKFIIYKCAVDSRYCPK